MDKLEKVIKGIEFCTSTTGCTGCPYEDHCNDIEQRILGEAIMRDALELLKEKQPRVLTFEEVINHYSVPEEIKDDFDKRIDYQMDIEPLYWDFPIGNADSFIVHWRGFESIGSYIERWKPDYGLSWRCWTARPTEEQRNAVPWKDGDGE